MSKAGFEKSLQALVAQHSLGWLVAANVVGVILASLLAWPSLGDGLGAYSYGHWVPLHLNWQLYGWCSLPLVGLLFRRYLPHDALGLTQGHWGLRLWTSALVLGGVSWVSGDTSGKLFLDWSGFARVFFSAALLVLWGFLVWNWTANFRRSSTAWSKRWADIVIFFLLLGVPTTLWWTTGRKVYPAVDPGTGGPTGASLLASTLVIVLIAALIPSLLGLIRPPAVMRRIFWSWFVLDWGIFFYVGEHNASHHEVSQILALGSLVIWIPLLSVYLWGCDWEESSRLWLGAALGWWAALVLTGLFCFWPGILDQIKFTHALVAHAHLAMAGFLSSLNMLILCNLSRPQTQSVGKVLTGKIGFYVWQFALLLHLTSLVLIARMEVLTPGVLYQVSIPHGWFHLRLTAGVVMALLSMHWWVSCCRGGTAEELNHEE